MALIYTLQRTPRSVPHAYFNSYVEAQMYNNKYFDGKYVVIDHVITRM